MCFADIVAAYEADFPLYVELAELVEVGLTDALKSRGIYTLPVTARAKDPLSFGLKACVGHKYDDPMAQIEDKAGVRVTVIYERDVDRVIDVVRETFEASPPDRKLGALDYDKNGYVATHLNAKLTVAQIAAGNPELADRTFEVQIRTVVQTAWAEVSHAQLYKPPAEVPDELKRRIYRLVALVELFDSEVEGFLSEAEQIVGYKEAAAVSGMAAVLAGLGNTHAPDRRLTSELAAAIVPLYDMPLDDTTRIVTEFAEARAEGLRTILSESQRLDTHSLNPLLAQPELPMICERLERDRINLEQAWPANVPFQWLDDLAEKWGFGRAPQ